jgi:hypothetical protein
MRMFIVLDIDIEKKNSSLIETCKMLMMNEYEIIHWAKYIDRFNLNSKNFEMEIFFIGLATKLLLNT